MNKLIKTKVSAVRCIQASRCKNTGKEIFTLELEYPRVVHSQLLTHGVFSKNSSSTRAVPLEAAIKQILENPAKVIWTTNQSGMQGEVVTDELLIEHANYVYHNAMSLAIDEARTLQELGIHKQNAGRLLEPFQNIKIVLTATEWENWDWLRIHEDAQGEIADLATAMKEARDTAEIMEIGPGEWHVPYVERERSDDGSLMYYISEFGDEWLNGEQAKQISSSVCAQISYRKGDYSLEKAEKMEGMLVDGHKVHASPFEHQCMAFGEVTNHYDPKQWPKGITHVDRQGVLWSANMSSFIQHRQLIKNHDPAKPNYD